MTTLEIIPLSEWFPSMFDAWAEIREAKRTPGKRRIVTAHHTVGGAGLDPDDFADDIGYLRAVATYHWHRKGKSGYPWRRPGGYNFAIPNDASGRAFEMSGWEWRGVHAGTREGNLSLGVAIVGDFRTRRPAPEAVETLRHLIAVGADLGHLIPSPALRGHRDWKPTTCPGDAFYDLLPNIDTAHPAPAAPARTHRLFTISTNLPTLRRGARGPAVATAQGLLLARRYGPSGLVNRSGLPDGIFGPKTAGEVRRFQTDTPPLVVDGVVGPATWTRLLAP